MTTLKDEWFDYKTSYIPEDWATEPDGTYKCIDYYWSKVLDKKTKSGQPRYHVLPKVIKSVLTLAHGMLTLKDPYQTTRTL